MSLDIERAFAPDVQFELAYKAFRAMMAMTGGDSTPEVEARALENARQAQFEPKWRELAAALQALGVALAMEPIQTIFESPEDAKRFEALRLALESASSPAALAQSRSTQTSFDDFKKAMCGNIVVHLAEMLARDTRRAKSGPTFLINKNMQGLADEGASAFRSQLARALTAFLISLPDRYPSFGPELFAWAQGAALGRVKEEFNSPEIDEVIGGVFQDALGRMSPESRRVIGGEARG